MSCNSLRRHAENTNFIESASEGVVEIESISDERAALLPKAYAAAVRQHFYITVLCDHSGGPCSACGGT